MSVNRLVICSVGDLMICDSPLYVSVGVGSKYQEIKGRLFSDCKELFDEADIVIGNFEGVVYNPINKSLKESQMSCPEDVILELKDAGFSILNLANNHTLQHGTDNFEFTRKTCEKSGIKPIGIKNEDPYFQIINGIKIIFLSLCIHLEWYQPDNILYESNIARIIHSVKELRDQGRDDVIVVNVHWGDEFASFPSNAQVALAHELVDCGTDIILGHHSHVYQGIEKYKNSIIVYSQGNFISDMVPEMCKETGILRISIETNVYEKKVSYVLTPYCISSDFIPRKNGANWFINRQHELENVINQKVTDDNYWQMVSKKHAKAHSEYKMYFQKTFTNYRIDILVKMLLEFFGRKIKRIIGKSTDGRISSMDPIIYKILGK